MVINRLKNLFSDSAPLLDPLEAYELWAETYDNTDGNALLYVEGKALRPFLDPSLIRDRDVLDAGCGTGRYLPVLHGFRPRSITATDLSPHMLERARGKADNVSFHVCPIDNLPFPDASFDFILCTLVLGHVRHLSSAIDELARVLRSGGSIAISDFHSFGQLLGWQRTFTAGSRDYAVRYTMHLYADFFNAFRSAGLEIVMMDEPRIDASLESFYAKAGRRDMYQRYKNFPILILFRVTKT